MLIVFVGFVYDGGFLGWLLHNMLFVYVGGFSVLLWVLGVFGCRRGAFGGGC